MNDFAPNDVLLERGQPGQPPHAAESALCELLAMSSSQPTRRTLSLHGCATISTPHGTHRRVGACLRGLLRRWAHGALALAALAMAASCTSVRFDVPRPPSHALDKPELTALAQSYAPQLSAAPGRSGFHLLVSGPEAFAARVALAEASQRTLDLQYYIVAHDATTTLLLDAALRAAQRGVRVRLLVDDLNLDGRESDLAVLAGHPNLQVRLFNPFAVRGGFGVARLLELLGDTARLNRRMHNKLWIADGAVAVMGGRNLGDAYFNASPESDFADLDVLAAGPVVGEVSRSFDAYWNSDWAVPIAAVVGPAPPRADLEPAWAELAARAARFRASDYVRALRATALGARVRTGQLPLALASAKAHFDLPADPNAVARETTSAIFPALREVVEKAQREVLMVSPYLVPGEKSVAVLCALVGRGVRVRMLTNSLASTDVPPVHAGYALYRPQLLACGVALHELRPRRSGDKAKRIGLSSGTSLHSKAIVVDGETLFIGSMNLDPRSRHLNTEVALKIESASLGRELSGLFDEATTLEQAFRVELGEPGNASAALHWASIEDGQPVRYSQEPLTSAWRRFLSRVLGALAPEGLM